MVVVGGGGGGGGVIDVPVRHVCQSPAKQWNEIVRL